MKKQQIPEDFEISDEEATTIKLDEEQKVSSKFITFDCPLRGGKLQVRNEIEINPKGVTYKCNPCSFKISKSEKAVNVSRDDDGGIQLDSQDHSISFSFNRRVTPEDQKTENTNRMISDVKNNTLNTPKSRKLITTGEMDE